MSRQIEFEHLNLSKWIPDEELKNFKSTVEHARNTLVKRDGAGNDFTGWLNHPVAYDKEEFEKILQAAEEIRQNCDVLLVVGIGGSYLGARAAIEFLHHSFFNSLPDEKRKAPRIYFCGNSNSSKYLADLEDMLEGCDFSVNVISKSGTTTESAVAFRIIKQKLEEKYGKKNIYFVSISCDRDKAAWEKMVKEDKLGGIQLHNGGDNTFMDAYMITGIPRFILLDKEGKIINAKMTRPSNPETAKTFDALEGI